MEEQKKTFEAYSAKWQKERMEEAATQKEERESELASIKQQLTLTKEANLYNCVHRHTVLCNPPQACARASARSVAMSRQCAMLCWRANKNRGT